MINSIYEFQWDCQIACYWFRLEICRLGLISTMLVFLAQHHQQCITLACTATLSLLTLWFISCMGSYIIYYLISIFWHNKIQILNFFLYSNMVIAEEYRALFVGTEKGMLSAFICWARDETTAFATMLKQQVHTQESCTTRNHISCGNSSLSIVYVHNLWRIQYIIHFAIPEPTDIASN